MPMIRMLVPLGVGPRLERDLPAGAGGAVHPDDGRPAGRAVLGEARAAGRPGPRRCPRARDASTFFMTEV